MESNYFSIYKGVPVFQIDGDRSGSVGVIFITGGTNTIEHPKDLVRHEYGHVQQLKELGIAHYFVEIFIPSAGMWGNGDYYDKAFETSADIYGGVQSRTYTDAEIMYSMAYLEVCDYYGPFAWILIGLGDVVYD